MREWGARPIHKVKRAWSGGCALCMGTVHRYSTQHKDKDNTKQTTTTARRSRWRELTASVQEMDTDTNMTPT